MDKETEKQALEAYHKARIDGLVPSPLFTADCEKDQSIWLAAWESRGRASGQQGVEESPSWVPAHLRKTVGGQPVGLTPLLCESEGGSYYCRHCGKDMNKNGDKPCPSLEELRLRMIPDELVEAFGCKWEAMHKADGAEPCEKWCHRPDCVFSLKLAASPQITSSAEVVGFLVTSGVPGYSIVKRAAQPTSSDSQMAMWRGKPVNELTRDELLEALSWCCRDNVELRDDRDKWRRAGDVKKYLLQK